MSAGGVLLLDRPLPTTYVHTLYRQQFGTLDKQLMYHGALTNEAVTGYVGEER